MTETAKLDPEAVALAPTLAAFGIDAVDLDMMKRGDMIGPNLGAKLFRALSLSPPTGGWKDLDTAPLKRTIVVGRHDWDNVTTVNWANEASKAADLANWSSPPTHWLDGVTLPSPPEAE